MNYNTKKRQVVHNYTHHIKGGIRQLSKITPMKSKSLLTGRGTPRVIPRGYLGYHNISNVKLSRLGFVQEV